ncbi:hypothetical protein BV22DRAFT_403375 [Leucogyrophana mollusca]|uniref:Uncharacterized protein n=1 Tax=Leucogyrophana mollusca TaxID=85980 RepID=A0ACB8BIY4_9AGAM|nr:hypothetical protein BV22DRAFT_403375 [Leucogyrophana mollusca]
MYSYLLSTLTNQNFQADVHRVRGSVRPGCAKTANFTASLLTFDIYLSSGPNMFCAILFVYIAKSFRGSLVVPLFRQATGDTVTLTTTSPTVRSSWAQLVDYVSVGAA